MDNPPGFRNPVQVVQDGERLPDSLVTLTMQRHGNRPRVDFTLREFEDITAHVQPDFVRPARATRAQNLAVAEPTVLSYNGQQVLRLPPCNVAETTLYITSATQGHQPEQNPHASGFSNKAYLDIAEIYPPRSAAGRLTRILITVRKMTRDIYSDFVISPGVLHALIETGTESDEDPILASAASALPVFLKTVADIVPESLASGIAELAHDYSSNSLIYAGH
jgi:hypothetical protein